MKTGFAILLLTTTTATAQSTADLATTCRVLHELAQQERAAGHRVTFMSFARVASVVGAYLPQKCYLEYYSAVVAANPALQNIKLDLVGPGYTWSVLRATHDERPDYLETAVDLNPSSSDDETTRIWKQTQTYLARVRSGKQPDPVPWQWNDRLPFVKKSGNAAFDFGFDNYDPSPPLERYEFVPPNQTGRFNSPWLRPKKQTIPYNDPCATPTIPFEQP